MCIRNRAHICCRYTQHLFQNGIQFIYFVATGWHTYVFRKTISYSALFFLALLLSCSLSLSPLSSDERETLPNIRSLAYTFFRSKTETSLSTFANFDLCSRFSLSSLFSSLILLYPRLYLLLPVYTRPHKLEQQMSQKN